MKIKNILQIFLFSSLLLPLTMFGATVKVGEEVIIRSDEEIKDNLYITAGSVSVDTYVDGDLISIGGNVVISEDVADDLAIIGGDITFLGDVAGDVRVVGGTATIGGNIEGDLVVISGVVQLLPDSVVEKDVLVSGGKVSLAGHIKGDVKVAGGDIDIDSTVDGNVTLEIGEKSAMSGSTVIGGDLTYRGKDESVLNMSDGVIVLGETSFEVSRFIDKSVDNIKIAGILAGMLGMFVVFKFITLIISALVLILIFKKLSLNIVKGALSRKGKEFVRGFVIAIVVPVLIFALFMTFFGSLLGCLIALGYIFAITLAKVYAGVIFGSCMQKTLNKSENIELSWKSALLGVVALFVIGLIPFVGCLFVLFFMTIALGSISNILYEKVWQKR
ncbi:hypothetical protein ACFLY7_00575 [Patescibacteria group bacterium]